MLPCNNHQGMESRAPTRRDAMSVGIIVPLPAYTLNPAFIASKAEVLGFEWKRNKKVSVHPCPEHLGVQDTRRGDIVGPTRGHQEVRAEQGVARCGGDVAEHGHGRRGLCLCAHRVFLPPPRSQTDSPCAPVSLRSRGLIATFLLRFQDRLP
jgi:hypothetical protein